MTSPIFAVTLLTIFFTIFSRTFCAEAEVDPKKNSRNLLNSKAIDDIVFENYIGSLEPHLRKANLLDDVYVDPLKKELGIESIESILNGSKPEDFMDYTRNGTSAFHLAKRSLSIFSDYANLTELKANLSSNPKCDQGPWLPLTTQLIQQHETLYKFLILMDAKDTTFDSMSFQHLIFKTFPVLDAVHLLPIVQSDLKFLIQLAFLYCNGIQSDEVDAMFYFRESLLQLYEMNKHFLQLETVHSFAAFIDRYSPHLTYAFTRYRGTLMRMHQLFKGLSTFELDVRELINERDTMHQKDTAPFQETMRQLSEGPVAYIIKWHCMKHTFHLENQSHVYIPSEDMDFLATSLDFLKSKIVNAFRPNGYIQLDPEFTELRVITNDFMVPAYIAKISWLEAC